MRANFSERIPVFTDPRQLVTVFLWLRQNNPTGLVIDPGQGERK
jgi:hypothetical protein